MKQLEEQLDFARCIRALEKEFIKEQTDWKKVLKIAKTLVELAVMKISKKANKETKVFVLTRGNKTAFTPVKQR